jgi:hypothetical protein
MRYPAISAVSCSTRVAATRTGRPEARGRNFNFTPPTALYNMGPVSSWNGLEVVQGVQIGHRGALGSVAGEPDRRQRQLLCLLRSPHKRLAPGRWGARRACSAHMPSPQMQVQATEARVTPCPASGTISRRSLKFRPINSFSHFCLERPHQNGADQYFLLLDILFRGIYVTSRCPGFIIDRNERVLGEHTSMYVCPRCTPLLPYQMQRSPRASVVASARILTISHRA